MPASWTGRSGRLRRPSPTSRSLGRGPIADLHYYAGDALIRLERPAEAEYHLLQELRAFPRNVRARGALAALYNETGRADEAGEVLTAMIRVSPTPEAYSLAARLWTSFGNPSQAAAVRADAARASAGRTDRPDRRRSSILAGTCRAPRDRSLWRTCRFGVRPRCSSPRRVIAGGPTARARQQTTASRLVLATVTDAQNRVLADLGPDDFVVSENGEMREVVAASRPTTP